MSGADFQALATLGAFLSFSGLLYWICVRCTAQDFAAAARLPLLDDAPNDREEQP